MCSFETTSPAIARLNRQTRYHCAITGPVGSAELNQIIHQAAEQILG